ncbi:hypothetical protein QOZ80_2AG0122760 [Eleusine coracana subsp. coracana]|nr:hypothetical protein QOZ80_2AG0122760 [Eleusine coracana subsp. coracana]
MEASFVDQLYGHDKHGIDVMRSQLVGSGFKLIRDSVCKNIRFQEVDACKGDFVGSGLPDNLLIRRFRPRNAGTNHHGHVAEDSVDDYGSGTDTVREKVRIHGREVRGLAQENLIEVSDQNFSEEEVIVKANYEPCKKRKPSRDAQNDRPT